MITQYVELSAGDVMSSVHFAKEEQLYLPLLEQAGPEVQHVLEALRELEHV